MREPVTEESAMRSVPNTAPVTVQLSNWLTVQAAELAGEVARFKRASVEAHAANVWAGHRPVEVRGECKRRQWRPFLRAAGVEEGTSRDMMKLARAGVTADRITEYGGVRGALEVLRAAVAGISRTGGGEEPGVVAAVRHCELSSPSGGVPVGAEGVSKPVAGSEGPGPRRAGSGPARSVREALAAGLCRCGRPRVPGRKQFGPCLNWDRERTRSRLAGGRLAAALDRRLRSAAAKDRGVSLSPVDVKRLLGVGVKP